VSSGKILESPGTPHSASATCTNAATVVAMGTARPAGVLTREPATKTPRRTRVRSGPGRAGGPGRGQVASVQVIGPRYREDLCLDAAAALEDRVGIITPIDPR
jgi:hypothetical protein